jgi:hypothetical protein
MYSDMEKQKLDDPEDATCGQRAILALYRMAHCPNDMRVFTEVIAA